MAEKKYTSLPVEKVFHRELKLRAAQKNAKLCEMVDHLIRVGLACEGEKENQVAAAKLEVIAGNR